MIAATGAADRPRWFAVAFAVLALNGGATLAATAIRGEGLAAAAFDLFGISAILWVAGAAGLAILRDAPPAPLHRLDPAILVPAALAALVPVPAAAALALTGLAGWAIATSAPAAPLRRAAIIFLAITSSLLWGRLLLALFSGPLLSAEGWLAGSVAGTGGTGNVVEFGGGGFYSVAPGCSSLQGVSLAAVLWVAIVQFYRMPLRAGAWLTLAAAVTATIALNVVRLAAIATWPAHFHSLHVGLGATAFGWAGLVAIVAICWIGMRGALVVRA